MTNGRISAAILVMGLLAAGCSGGADLLSATTVGPATETAAPVASGAPNPADARAVIEAAYAIVDTGQAACYDEQGSIFCPAEGDAFWGQDGNYEGNQPSYADNGDGTVTDLVTGLVWQQDPGEKMTYAEAAAGADSLELAGYDDWRLPTIKELYSLIEFTGTDPSSCQSNESCGSIPFIDGAFDFEYGDTENGERLIDSQWATSTIYEGLTMGGDETMFGVNFADGRIKGYPTGADPSGAEKEFFVIYVRGNEAYGQNDFVDNGDGTVSDLATLVTWQQGDSGSGMDWESSLGYCESLDTGGHDDWRLPSVKELQSIVDYARSPQSTGTAAIDPVFSITSITDEGGNENYGMYWSSTTHASMSGGQNAAYVAFGEALGWMSFQGGEPVLMDVHGAGAQRSDPKTGDAADYPYGHGPQGDVVRLENMVRCVRGGEAVTTSGGFTEAATSDAGESGQPPSGSLAEAAAALGIDESTLAAAMGDPSQGPPDVAEAAGVLGITVEELQAVLPPPPAGG